MNNNIAVLRKQAGLSQKELGVKLGVGQTTISGWEIGRNEPDNASLQKMAQLFNKSIEQILGYEVDENEEEARAIQRELYGMTTFDDFPEVVAIAKAAVHMDTDQRARMLAIVENAFPGAFLKAR